MKKYDTIDEFIKAPLLKEGNIYHYTSAEGLLGILENAEFWATKGDFLNDKSEFKYTFELFENSILKKIKNGIVKSKLISYYHSDKLDKNNLVEKFSDWYIVSFSINEDNLLLWSEFTNKLGYNLGFDSLKIAKAFTEKIKLHGKVVYNKNKQIKLLEESTKMIFSLREEYGNIKSFDDIDESVSDEILNNLALDMSVFCIAYSMFFKQSIFEKEEEYRFVFSDFKEKQGGEIVSREMNFRVKEDSIIPFIKIPFKVRECLESITIGPKNIIDISEVGLTTYCQNKKILVPILKSNIPLRY